MMEELLIAQNKSVDFNKYNDLLSEECIKYCTGVNTMVIEGLYGIIHNEEATPF